MKFLLVTLSWVAAVTAYPNGAPVCAIGASSVQSLHLIRIRDPQSGTNEEAGYQTSLAGSPLIADPADPTFTNLFIFGVENQLIIQAGVGSYLKGIFVVASGGDLNSLDTRTPQALTITDAAGTMESIGCDNFDVSSIVQSEPSEKDDIGMSFKWPTIGQKLFLDVNIVKNNNITLGSQYYYTQYAMLSESNATCTPASSCGLLGLSFFCPATRCGLLGRLLGLCVPSSDC